MSMAMSSLLIHSGYLFIEIACQWYLLVHGGCLFMGAVGL